MHGANMKIRWHDHSRRTYLCCEQSTNKKADRVWKIQRTHM